MHPKGAHNLKILMKYEIHVLLEEYFTLSPWRDHKLRFFYPFEIQDRLKEEELQGTSLYYNVNTSQQLETIQKVRTSDIIV